MNFLIKLSLISMCFSAHSFEVNKQVHDVVEPDRPGEDYLILNKDGSVMFSDDVEQVESLKAGRTYQFQIDENNSLEPHSQALELRSEPQEDPTFGSMNFQASRVRSGTSTKGWEYFQMSMLPGYSQVRSLFYSMNRAVSRGSQCYHKAHYWAYELAKRGVQSGKAFLFFTQEYIREYNFNWWFHVAPTVQTGHNQFLIMDRYFFDQPVEPTTWTNNWVKSGATCPEIGHYDEYFRRQYNAHCYIRHVPMHYFEPKDIERLDRSNIRMDDWRFDQVQVAYHNVGQPIPRAQIPVEPQPPLNPRPVDPIFPDPIVPDPIEPDPIVPPNQGCECATLNDGSCGIWKKGENIVLEVQFLGSCSAAACHAGFSPETVVNQCGNSITAL